MRRWGVVVSGFYAVLVASLFWPTILRLAGRSWPEAVREVFRETVWPDVLWWVVVGLMITGQALLLFLAVDTSWRHAKPRQQIWISVAVVGFFVGLLALAFISCVWVTISEDSLVNNPVSPWRDDWFEVSFVVWLFVLWALWGAAFYSYHRGAPTLVVCAITWLLSASVLELLVAVPAHVIVRRREDCSAPVVTGFGIATGIAVMLACFGPGVLLLYKKRLERYRAQRKTPALHVP